MPLFNNQQILMGKMNGKFVLTQTDDLYKRKTSLRLDGNQQPRCWSCSPGPDDSRETKMSFLWQVLFLISEIEAQNLSTNWSKFAQVIKYHFAGVRKQQTGKFYTTIKIPKDFQANQSLSGLHRRRRSYARLDDEKPKKNRSPTANFYYEEWRKFLKEIF